jgi:aromatic ring-opening dioxygenase catalytic subunit (LigB family)
MKKNKIELDSDEKWGFDHGNFNITKLLSPEGKIPVVSISLKSDFDTK